MLQQDAADDGVTRRSPPMIKYSHCDSYYVNTTKFTYWSVYDGLTHRHASTTVSPSRVYDSLTTTRVYDGLTDTRLRRSH